MKTKLIISMLVLLLQPLFVEALHLYSGYISYTVDAQNPRQFNFVLTLYTDMRSSADDPVVSVQMGDGNTLDISNRKVTRYSQLYDRETFTWSYIYSSPGNYTVSWSGINRNSGVINSPEDVETQSMYIYTKVKVEALTENKNGVKLAGIPILEAYTGEPMTYNLLAYDADGDRLTYDLVPPKHKTQEGVVSYLPGYQFPQGLRVDKFGELQWDNPSIKGPYIVALLVTEWRGDKVLGSMVVDMTLNVTERSRQPELTLLNRDRLNLSQNDGSVLARPNQPLKLEYLLRNSPDHDLPLSARQYGELDTLNLPNTTLAVRDTTEGLAVTLTFTPTSELQRQEPYLIGVRGRAGEISFGEVSSSYLEFDWGFTYVYVGEQLPTAAEDELTKAGFTLYPNPATNRFVIEAPEMPAMHLQLYNATGKAVGSLTLKPGKNTINKSPKMSSGLYFYTISSRQKPIGSGRLVVH
ncbi:putative secreted protein (Por secretion system target) [Pontibacter ummariensis]|uniref:Por secretion system C-terminal sorting domain-containing protein n=1 Tax=Pontibacter ummariensis TaxID=1610492 RepID=A0A239E5B5_9BACT|nr:T9SS type A sorting domain-containing protein [Pontibacter ummariensis]PRY13091.1 putative secreted protein (Por secretion system target) [Pontibacter ummariensis]SNS39866.1 Por secretion system C-terminal sorting domain-containing protein [Pontibacter ummariensis]